MNSTDCMAKHINSNSTETYKGHIVDITGKSVFPGVIVVKNGVISDIIRIDSVEENAPYYLPALTDAHIHIESSMMTPVNFAKVAVCHGVINAVCDPHEIVNVLGIAGLDFMIGNAKDSRFKFFFGLPSCVPSSHLETAGANIDANMTREYIRRDDIYFLAEMMNYPGVIAEDKEVIGKIDAALQAGKKIDGHAPGIKGDDLRKYAEAGISTDHECSTVEEARERIKNGIKVIVREGSAARNFDALYSIIAESPEMVMLCSDDKHPDDLVAGHIDALVRRGIAKGISIWDILQAACINPVNHYKLPVGLMRKGDNATFIAVDNLVDFNVVSAIIDGYLVYDSKNGLIDHNLTVNDSINVMPNNFEAEPITLQDIFLDASKGCAKVIVAVDGELLTDKEIVPVEKLSDPEIQKIVVYNRYGNGKPQVGFIKGFNISNGAIGATIAHDSHNIVAIGSSDLYLVKIINALIGYKGGVGVVSDDETDIFPLPVAGLMSHEPANTIAENYNRINAKTKSLGCKLKAPFITMAFMALPVIPELKLTDKGLVDVSRFDFVDVIN